MTAIGTGSAPLPAVATRGLTLTSLFAAAGTILVIVALALLPLLTPWFMHPTLDAAESAAWLRMTPESAHALSDETVAELVLGPATFAFNGPDGAPFYDPAEQAHLRDARALLLLLATAAVIAAVGLAIGLRRGDRARILRAISKGGAVTAVAVAVIGVIGIVAFEPLFELFHRIFFPGGGWAFDPRTEHLVQLYPYAFWQLAAAVLGLLAFLLGLEAWWLGRRLSRAGA